MVPLGTNSASSIPVISAACNTVTVTNTTDAPIVWTAVVKVMGNMQNAWNCKYTAIDGGFSFTGEAWNAEVAAKQSVSFGFCLNY